MTRGSASRGGLPPGGLHPRVGQTPRYMGYYGIQSTGRKIPTS